MQQGSDRSQVRLGNVCLMIGSGATPRGGKESYVDEGVTLIRSQNVYNSGFDRAGLAFITDSQASQLDNVEVLEDDVLLNITGASVARCCQVPTEVLPARVNQHVVIIRPKPNQLDARYLRYYLISPAMQARMLQLAGAGATRQALTKRMIENFEIPRPPLPEQRRIAAVLGALDDKIALNRRMNRTLEATAQALFRHRFIDFGGRDDLVDSGTDLGEIPAGWTVQPLDSIAHFLNGTAWSRYKPESENEETLRVIKIRELRQGFDEKSDLVSEERLPGKYVIDNGDVIFSWSGSLVLKLWTHGRGALNQHLFKVSSEQFPRWFYYSWVRHYIDHFRRIAKSKATTMGHIKRRHLTEALVAVPSEDELQQLDSIFGPLMKRRLANDLESHTLAALRDTLLPKLISGEIRVPHLDEAS